MPAAIFLCSADDEIELTRHIHVQLVALDLGTELRGDPLVGVYLQPPMFDHIRLGHFDEIAILADLRLLAGGRRVGDVADLIKEGIGLRFASARLHVAKAVVCAKRPKHCRAMRACPRQRKST